MAEYRAALVLDNGQVQTVVILDDALTWGPPDGLTPVAVPDDVPVMPGWSYDGVEFLPPPPPEVLPEEP